MEALAFNLSLGLSAFAYIITGGWRGYDFVPYLLGNFGKKIVNKNAKSRIF
jgi:hypothetical protein